MIFNNVNPKIIKTKEYLRGEILFNINDLITSLAYIKRGSITVINQYNKIIAQYNKNDIINLPLLFSTNSFYEDKYIANTLSTIDFISKEDLLKIMEENKQLKIEILKLLSNYSLALKEHTELLSYKTNKEKICAYLLLEAKQKKASSFLISYTKTELASYLNIERHLLSIEIQNLINAGIIANKNKLYTIIKKDELIKTIS